MKILFVCLGNICRSPLAEGILLHLNEKQKLGWTIDSAGTANYHVGEAPDVRTIKNAAKHSIDLKPLRARQFETKDFELFDFIFVMDHSNYQNVIRVSQNEQHRKKVKLFLEYVSHTSLMEVPDPYYGAEQGFEEVFQLLFGASKELINILQKQ